MYEKRAMLVELTIRQWTARKHDKRVSREVDQTHAAKNGGRYNKQLISKTALSAIATKAGAIRDYHYAMTLPWGNNGQRLLPAASFITYRNAITAHKREYMALVDAFLARYPAEVAEAQRDLGTLFDASEYPTTVNVARSFGVELEILPVPTFGDFRVEVADMERDEIQEQIKELTAERQRAAIEDCYDRAREVLERVKAQCVPGKTRITESLVSSVDNLIGTLGALNINDDPELEALRQRIENELTVSADGLRNDEPLRVIVGDHAAEMLKSMPWG